ncbi:DUF3105 domain-containing protein [Aquipuribacter sp. MA13-6]|uniref:DUF3105 domain-containing protein n=1 Tax=unclassified Aquipuribacter TaxID=2635084 RepID=UPI003EEC23FC
MSTGPTDSTTGVVDPPVPPDSPPRPRGVTTWGLGRTVAFIAVTSLALAALVGGVAFALLAPLLRDAGPGVNADGSIDGLMTFDGLSNLHVETPVDYEPSPPVGGDHLAVWQDCGFYDAAIITEAGVHSLEHGAVWVTYDRTLPADQRERLEQLAAEHPYLLVSPMAGLPTPVVASAWGVQVQLPSADDERLPAFLLAYLQGPQNPEPGAPCSGGLSGTASQQSQV